MGYAYSRKKIVIPIAQSSDDLFFDVHDDRTIIYKKHNLKSTLKQPLELSLEAAKKDIKQMAIEEYYSVFPHKAVSQVVGSKKIPGTRFDFFNMVKSAKQHVFLAAQNHYFFVRSEGNKKKFRDEVLRFLRRHPQAIFDIMLCSNEKKYEHAIKTWQYVTKERYKEDLEESVEYLRNVLLEINKNPKLKGRLRIHKVEFVPFSINFFDPDDEENGILAFVPNAYEEKNIARPVFALSRKKNSYIFDQYWPAFRQRFEDIKNDNI